MKFGGERMQRMSHQTVCHNHNPVLVHYLSPNMTSLDAFEE
jgi:hypothetical protein